MAVTGFTKGSRIIPLIVAIIFILVGVATLAAGSWARVPVKFLQFSHGAAKMASTGIILLGIGLIFMQGMTTFEQKAGLYNLCMIGFYGGGGLGAILFVLALFQKGSAG